MHGGSYRLCKTGNLPIVFQKRLKGKSLEQTKKECAWEWETELSRSFGGWSLETKLKGRCYYRPGSTDSSIMVI